MMNRASILAGTALALVMATAHAQAVPQAATTAPVEAVGAWHDTRSPVLLAQAEEEELTEEELLRRRQQQEAEEPAPEEEAPPADEPAPEPEPELQFEEESEPAPEEEEPAPAEPEAPVTEEEQPAPEAVEPEQPAEPEPEPEAQPEPEAPVEPTVEPEPAPAEEEPAVEPQQPADEPADEGLQFDPEPPAEEAPAAPAPEADPAPETGEPATDDRPGEPVPEDDGQPADGAAPVEDDTPILDSDKEEEAGEPQPETEGLTFEDPGPPPVSDEEAQQLEEPVEVESLRAEEGRRVERREAPRERREGMDVLREIGDRIVIQLNNQVIVQSDDRGRMERDAEEVYYEELPRGRTRETIVRPNGVQVVTVYDRYGDVVRRSRIMPDGREHVLVYADRRDRDERRQWRDPALDLPPLRLTIPREEYILDARNVRSEDLYYDFLDQPPVEPVRRLYTIDEVKYSARVRDSVRRIDLDTITFEFGSASISESEIPRLEGVAVAMERLLERNPAETFLIEGHTDAVGSDEANLALSDRRAESVAMALTNVFGIPPENLVTQGYGERYLKVDTQEPERQNRRVAMRRITPLVAPVAGIQQ